MKIVPTLGPNNGSSGIAVPLHTTLLLSTVLSTGVGFTVIVKVIGVPVQLTPPLVKVGVTVMVATTCPGVLFMAVKLAIFPTPLAANPIDGREFVQLYTIVPPVVGLVKVTAAVALLLHTIWFDTALTTGVGFTV